MEETFSDDERNDDEDVSGMFYAYYMHACTTLCILRIV